MRVVGKRVRFGGEAHCGWLPEGASTPVRIPVRQAVVDVTIEFDGHGFLLICESRNTPDSSDTWHASLDEAIEHAGTQLGIKAGEWKVESDPAVMTLLLEEELRKDEPFQNSHGITRQNLREHLIKPALVKVQCHMERKQASVWIVLEERVGKEGYLIGFDTSGHSWALVYREADGTYTLMSYGGSFIGLLEHM